VEKGTAEASELELSWATGRGLPICCISGLADAEPGTGSGCRALEEATVSKLFGSHYYIFTKVALEEKTDGQLEIVCICGGGQKKA